MSLFRSRIIPLSLVTLSLIGCGAIETSVPSSGMTNAQLEQGSGLSDYNYALAQAQAQSTPELAAPFYWAAAKALVVDEQYLQARTLLETHVLPVRSPSQFDGYLLMSDIALAQDTPMLALQMLSQAAELPYADRPGNNIKVLQQRAKVMASLDNWPNAVKDFMQLSLMLPADQQEQNRSDLWLAIQNLTDNEVSDLEGNQLPLLDGWLDASKILRQQSLTVEQQVAEFQSWQQLHSSHPAAVNPPLDFQIMASLEQNMPTSIAVMLPMSKELKVASESILNGILQQYYANRDVQPNLYIIDTDQYTQFSQAYLTALESGAETIIGPLRKQNVAQLADLVQDVPTIALNQLENNRIIPNLYHFSLNVSDDIRELMAFAKKQGAENSAILSMESTWALRQSDQFKEIAQQTNLPVLTSISYDNTPNGRAQAVKKLLQVDESEARIRSIQQWTQQDVESTPRARRDLDYVYYIGKLDDAKQIRPLLNFYFAEDIPMLASQTIHDKTPSSNSKSEDIERIIFTELPAVLESAEQHSNTPFVLQRLTALGNDSYLLAKRLALFANVKSAKVSARTGIITLDDDGIFNRRPNIVTYKQGELIDAKDSYFAQKEKE
ncbi:penicillin-binding protein activator [Marinomonas fungiae]|uniref:penicillin-binding protein activator n=1 Tax=Marinomonas fungiae TaxID=1137284 RepID=UPI003A8DDB02